MADGLQPILSLAEKRNMGTHLRTITAKKRCQWRCGLGNPLRRWQHCACPSACCGGKKSTPEAEALGRSQGGWSTKIHIRAEGGGKLMTFILTPGERHELSVAEELMRQGAVKRQGSGRPKLRPKRIVGDKGYSSRKFKLALQRRGIRYTIPRKNNERRTGAFDKSIYRTRNRVERLINRLKQFRRIATRYEKCAANYAAMLTIASIWLWL